MADNNNNGNQEEQTNIRTDSNLPILFANGYPTSLEKMSGDQLELFIPFLIKCSKDGSDEDEATVPKWWPSGIEFKIPLEKPKNTKKNWEATLRNIVQVCYDYHSQPFLLKYSHQLSQNDTVNLRYVTASDSTTSLFSRQPKKLLLTFRNENMLYDNKKKRMKLWTKDKAAPSSSSSPELIEQEDEDSSTFQIILCDFCDGEFYSDEAFTKHEKECGKTVEETPIVDNIVISDEEDDEMDEGDNVITGQNDFMAYFFLASSTATELPRRNNSLIERSLSPKKKKRAAQRTRNVISKKEKDLEKTIPFSSPAGLVLTKKCMVSDEYVEECLEDIDAYTTAKQTTKIPPRSRLRLQTGPDTAVLKDMRKTRNYYWPRKHLNSTARNANFEFLNRSIIEKLPQALVVLHKLTEADIRVRQENFRQIREEKKRLEAANCVDLCSDSEEDEAETSHVTDQINFQGDFVTMSMQRFVTPGISRLPQFSASPFNLPEVNITRSQRLSSTTTTTTSISRQLFTLPDFSPSPVAIAKSSKRPHEGGDTPETHKHVKIQNWIQNVNKVKVNGENFNTANQVSVVNIN